MRIIVGPGERQSRLRPGRIVRWPDGDPLRPPRYARRVRVVSETTGWLRQSLSTPLAWVTSRRATIVVRGWEAPRPGWSGRLGPLPAVVRHDVRLPQLGSGPAVVQVVLARPAPLYLVVAAALHALAPQPSMPAPVSP